MANARCATKQLDAVLHIVHFGDMENKLATYLKETGTSRREFAKIIGVDHSVVSKYASGDAFPGLDNALAIEEATAGKVPVAFWRDARLVGG